MIGIVLLAAGFFFPDLGATPLGRGATGAAGAGDLSAMVMNPAGLASLDGLRLQGEFSSTWQPIDFARAGNCGARPCATVSNSSGALLNTISGVSRSLRPGLVVAASVYGPPSMGRENFPDPRALAPGTSLTGAPQRYSLISENNLVIYPGVGAGWRALDWLDVGAVVQLRYFRARQVQTIYSLGGIGGELTDLDAVASADATDSARLVFGLGVIARPLPGLSIGLSARPGAPVHATGTLDVQLPQFATAAGATVTGRAARIDLNLPPEARLGIAWAGGPALVELDLTWENWGVLRSIQVTPIDIVIHQGGSDTRVGPISVPRNWHAAFSGRLGGEYELYSWLKLRAGALYESTAIPDETLQIDFAGLSRLAATAGATARWRSLSFTAGYAHYFQQSRTVTTSQVNRIDPYPAPAFVAGNGQYDTSLDVLALQVAATL
jgi:Outer membrane protein transport protein (OMPP1/FadL/TodX)